MDVRLDCAPHVGATHMVARGIFGKEPRHQAGFRQVSKLGCDRRELPDNLVKPPLANWAESFIFAGTSALLLLIANLFPDYWFFSLFALTPFLYRVIKASPSESLRLGILFGFSFFAVSEFGGSGFVGVIHELPLLISGTGIFGLFGWAVGWARKRWGFNPSIVALLWVGLEIGLVKLGFINGLFGKAEFSHSFFSGLVTLFGFLTVSAIIVLFNSLLVLLFIKTLEVTRPRGKILQKKEKIWSLLFTPGIFSQKVYLVPEGRAPPRLVA
jgi:apolipoprotein N-acyltransferase